MERRGILLDHEALLKDTDFYFAKLEELDDLICQQVGRVVEVDSNAQLADAIECAGLSTGFQTTPTGKRSTSKESLTGAISDPTLLGRLLIRGSIATSLRTFMQPWLQQAEAHEKLFVKWNQFRNYSDTGARTGRLSSSPNLQNIPDEWEALLAQLAGLGFVLPFELPNIRRYIVPPPGWVFIARDYSAQEMKLLAHFTQGGLLESLRANPGKDIHLIAAEIARVTRKVAKTLGFAVLYGAGVGRIAESLGIGVSEATTVKSQYLGALPEIKAFQKELKDNSQNGGYTETLGGRQYYVESPKVVDGRYRTFEYKLTNYKIQGSAADQTKRAMLDYCNTTETGQLVLSVHDQLVIQCPKEYLEREREILKQAVNGAYQEVLRYEIRSDESMGYNFGSMS
jgi:DNA polymerase-1